jgi:hypothetical protein
MSFYADSICSAHLFSSRCLSLLQIVFAVSSQCFFLDRLIWIYFSLCLYVGATDKVLVTRFGIMNDCHKNLE